MHCRGESGLGTWTVIVKDEIDNEHNGTFIDWHLKLWGESKDPSKTTLLPLPTDEDDKDHLLTMTTTIGATTTTLAPNPAATLNTSPPPLSTPSDHPDRPVNSKPTGTEGDNPEQTGAPEEGEETDPNKSSSWLPSFLPTFGAGPRTQIWIYGALALIIVFCVGLGIWLFLVRRQRLRNDPRGEYEFELLDDEEGEGLNGNSEKAGLVSGASGNRSRKTRRTRGEELYNAFAGSDEEDEAAEYRDGSDERLDNGEKVQRRSLDDGEEQHVIGEDSDEEDEGDASRPLARQ
jgi:kexin